MGSKSRRAQVSDKRPPTWRIVAWVVATGSWLLVTAALLSYDPADAPSYTHGVVNDPPRNWVGQAGAVLAHKAYGVIGPGVWLGVIGVAAWLVLTAIGRAVDQVVLRAIGLVLMIVSASTLLSMGVPTAVAGEAAGPHGGGGLLAVWVSDQLVTRFATPGTLLILLATFFIGAVLAADRLALAVPRVAFEAAMRLADVRRPTLRLPWPRRRGAAAGRSGVTDAEEARRAAIPVRGGTRGRGTKRDEREQIDESAGGFAATEPFDPDTAVASEEDEQEVEEADDAVDAPGAYVAQKREFDPDQLREKIRKLPINFAPRLDTSKAAPPREPDFSGYRFPELALLEEPESNFTEEMERLVREQAESLEAALREYRIEGEVVGIDSGPVITLYEVSLAPGTKVSRLHAVASDIARSLKAHNVRIVPNMAGKDTVGIEVPNLRKERVALKELMTADPDRLGKMKLPMFLGKDASGNPLVQDLASMPHMLIAGTTGSGKSVCMNSIIMSFLYTRRPDELKLVLVDPKMVEMSLFKDIPHLMCPVVTEMSKAAAILEWAVTKMDERYELLAEAGVRDIASYNDLGWEEIKARMEPATEEEEARIPKKLPYMVFVIDELADLMMTNKEVEGSIVRIAQKARAVGIHLILATQRPQANVVTGLIKSNMPARIAFKVASGMDSRIVLDQKGGELLLGQGDMLFLSPRSSKLTRAQGTLIADSEIRQTVKFLKTVSQQSFEPQLVQIRNGGAAEGLDEDRDPLFDDAVDIVLETQRGSVSLLQRRLTIGYARASRLIEQMAAAGIIGEYKGSQAREVLIGLDEWEAMKAQAELDARAGSDAGDDAAATVSGKDATDEEYSQEEDELEDDDGEYEDDEEDEYEEDEEEDDQDAGRG